MGTRNEVIEILGTWKLLEFSHTKTYECKSRVRRSGIRKRHYWLVECTNCGFQKKSQKSNLTPPSGGRCQNCWGRTKGESGMLVVMDSYVRNAAKYDREFRLTKEEFKNLTSDLCHYCKAPPQFVKKGGKRAKSIWGDYEFNGIDRIDNAIGYISSNCVTCCRICNRAKNTMVYDDFCVYISRIETNGLIGMV